MHKDIFEKLAQRFSSGPYEEEYRRSRQEYFNLIGSFGEDELFFENQMTRFLEWYLVDRCMDLIAIPPCRLYRLIFGSELQVSDRDMLVALEQSRHSLFQIHAVHSQGTAIFDLLDGKKEYLLKGQFYPEFRVSDLIDARIVESKDSFQLTPSAWMYPSEMKAWILETVAKHYRGNPHAFLIDLAYMKSKRDRFQHVPFEQIFQWEQIGKDREAYLKTKRTARSHA